MAAVANLCAARHAATCCAAALPPQASRVPATVCRWLGMLNPASWPPCCSHYLINPAHMFRYVQGLPAVTVNSLGAACTSTLLPCPILPGSLQNAALGGGPLAGVPTDSL